MLHSWFINSVVLLIGELDSAVSCRQQSLSPRWHDPAKPDSAVYDVLNGISRITNKIQSNIGTKFKSDTMLFQFADHGAYIGGSNHEEKLYIKSLKLYIAYRYPNLVNKWRIRIQKLMNFWPICFYFSNNKQFFYFT